MLLIYNLKRRTIILKIAQKFICLNEKFLKIALHKNFVRIKESGLSKTIFKKQLKYFDVPLEHA